ncbi:TlpA disulfide reductase family protein [Psychrobacillus sp. FJAT-51614]|uniref:TlpA disulfide reductase family protein n=1 Tax=Psychrobacillus mangrovi TaxID=3117745 RepID=A0ABU8FC40_9BACI
MKLREELPEFYRDLQWINGKQTKEQLIGELPLLVHFWSVSCSLCKGSMETINKWKGLYSGKFNIVSVHMPRKQEDINDVLIKTIIKQWKMSHSVCLDHNLNVTKAFQNRIVPSFYLFDKNGLLRHIQSGENGMYMLEKRLTHLMKEK